MASIERHGAGWRVRAHYRGSVSRVWLGRVEKTAAAAIAGHVAALVIASETATTIPAPTLRWVGRVGERLRGRLAAIGLVDESTPRSVAAFAAEYIATRIDLRPRSVARLRNSAAHLAAFFGEAPLAAITPADADRYRRHLAARIRAECHAGKVFRDARHYFRVAVRARAIPDNPFDGVATSHQQTAGRSAYITPDATAAIMAHASPQLALLIASARFGGLRVPSEPLEMLWDDVDAERGRVTVRAPKTHRSKPRRVVPLFPAWREAFERMAETATAGGHVFTACRSSAASSWRRQFLAAIHAAGFEPWPKLWHNLRASCRTDLLTSWPVHVADHWLGHSSAIGRKHYEMVTDEHYHSASGIQSPLFPPAGEPAFAGLPDDENRRGNGPR